MKKLTFIAALLALTMTAFAEDPQGETTIPPTVTVAAKGTDVRGVIHEMFTQQKKSYVMDPEIHYNLYLSLEKIDFDEALMIVCQTAKLEYKLQNGIYYVNKKKETPAGNPAVKKDDAASTGKSQTIAKPKGMLPASVYSKKVTTKFTKVDIRALFADVASQTELDIEVDSSVPKYRLDCFLNATSLKYALDSITQKTGLGYKFTNNMSILIYKKKEEGNDVKVVGG